MLMVVGKQNYSNTYMFFTILFGVTFLRYVLVMKKLDVATAASVVVVVVVPVSRPYAMSEL